MNRNTITRLVAALLLSASQLLAAEHKDSLALQKSYFSEAKVALEDMLDGRAPLSYERAVFLMENAWWEHKLDYQVFQRVVDRSVHQVKELVAGFYSEPRFDTLSLYERVRMPPAERKQAYRTALTNWAIFKYMTDTTLYIREDQVFYHLPYTYSFADPIGTTDWTNTQVTHLLDAKSGNCFALASLFKIFSDRLQSDAWLCTAPGHIYIRHNNDEGIPYNIELSNGGSFPGTGSIETFTHTTNEAANNNIAMRDLNQRQSVALCLVYLAKGYEYKFGVRSDYFMLACAEKALTYDSLNLNAMLLKQEVLEERILAKGRKPEELSKDAAFKAYQQWTTHLFALGYREMPMEMKNILVRGWMKDSTSRLFVRDHRPLNASLAVSDTRYASLSWGVFDEEMYTLPVEQYGRTLYDTKTKKITGFTKAYKVYNDYNFDPVAFAWNVDPLAHKYPGVSPYVFVNDNPIHYFDPDGQELQVGGVVNLSIKDLISLIPGKYRSELVVQDGKVQFKNYNSLPDEVKKYKGVALLQTMISSEKRYKYAVSEIAEGKNRVTGQPQAHKLAVEKEALEPRDANPQNAIRNLSKTERTDLPTGHEGNDLPEEGFDGAVFIRAGTFNRPHQASDDLIMDYPRNNVVYHELFENASRTEGDGGKGRDYQDAHNRAGANGNQFSKEVNGTRDLNSGSANGFDPQK